jgi:putative ABC transport system permease protein
MYQHYLKIALRSFAKSRLHTFIILIGLILGMSSCFLILLFVKHELSYEDFHIHKERIVRVIMDYNIGGNGTKGDYTSTYVGPSFQKNFPEVESFVRLANTSKVVKYKEHLYVENAFLYADSTFFDVFSYTLLSGDAKLALDGPNKVVLSQSMAKKYFGNENPLGKTLLVSANADAYQVTGIIQDCPQTTHLRFDFVASFATFGLEATTQRTYWNANYTTYLLLKRPESIHTLQPKIKPFMKEEMKDVFADAVSYNTYYFEPIKDIHLYSEFQSQGKAGSIVYVTAISIIALLILLIACFTYVNLSTARSSERAKEIGIRKSIGAYQSQLFVQFMSEAFVLTLLAFLFSGIVTVLTLPMFNSLVNRSLSASDLISIDVLCWSLGLLLLISLFSGFYPAYLLSSLNPVLVLKGNYKHSTRGLFLRKSIFLFQFAISVFLIITSVVLHQQLNYFQNKPLGYDKTELLVLPIDGKIMKQMELFKSELKTKANIKSIALSDFTPNQIMGGYSMQKSASPDDLGYGVNAGVIDTDYLTTCGMKLLAGRNISDLDIEQTEKDSLAYFHFILNESAVRQMSWTIEEAIGKKMYLDASRPGEVAGVIQDFHFMSLHTPIKPLVLFPSRYGRNILIKLQKNYHSESIKEIEQIWKTLFTHRPFDYVFLEDKYRKQYDSETRLGRAIDVFAAVAIILALLGLFGLSAYEVQQRAKEISMRKILGNPMYAIVFQLSKSFLILVSLSCVVALPLAWIVSSSWLEGFGYRTELKWWYFVFPCLGLILTAFATISFKAIYAALQSPIKYLKSE